MRMAEIVQAFEAKKVGRSYMARCPAHADRTPSLSISAGREHETVVHCNAGCDPLTVLQARGLTYNDLFDADSTIAKVFAKPRPRHDYRKPAYKPTEVALDTRVKAWFSGRGISDEVLRRNKIEYRKIWMPQIEAETTAICFPYFRGGQVINVKYRDGQKNFRLEKDAELCLYGLDDINPELPLYWVEGEIDKLSVEMAGITNCVSIPNGAGNPASRDFERELAYLESAQEILQSVPLHIMAVDNDEAGRYLQQELIRRLGPEKCAVVNWPQSCKDANDVLVGYDAEELRKYLDRYSECPVLGIYAVDDFEDAILELYHCPLPGGEYPGTDNLAHYYRPRIGEFTIVHGIPSMGKSQWVDWHTVQLAENLGWQFAVCSPEHQPLQRHASQLISIHVGKPFREGPSERMTGNELFGGIAWLKDHFTFLLPDEDMTIDHILELARIQVFRRGIKGLVIDPWNEFDHTRPRGMIESEYIGRTLIKIRRFARRHLIHIWLVAHPKMLQRNKDDEYPVPTPYDISGSAHWYNKPDMIVAIHRDKHDETKAVDVHVQKVKFAENGQIGICELFFDKTCGRYSDAPPTPPRESYRLSL